MMLNIQTYPKHGKQFLRSYFVNRLRTWNLFEFMLSSSTKAFVRLHQTIEQIERKQLWKAKKKLLIRLAEFC